MFNKNCKAKNCKNEVKDNIVGAYSKELPSNDMVWTYVYFCSTSCMKDFKKEMNDKKITWGNEWD